jgi:hypothetical protein
MPKKNRDQQANFSKKNPRIYQGFGVIIAQKALRKAF